VTQGQQIRLGRAMVWLLSTLMVGLLLLPLLGLALSTGFSEFVAGWSNPAVLPALWLSLETSTLSLLLSLLLGTPLAWLIAQSRGQRQALAESLFKLPMVIPPAVAGVALLVTFGGSSWLGAQLATLGLSLVFTKAAVVLAQTFVSAPYYLSAAISAFRSVDSGLMWVGRSLGAGPARVFFRIALPLAAPALFSGAAMCWARSLGEFGATLMFAGNLSGRTQTMPLAIFTALESDLQAAQALSIVLVLAALMVLFGTVLARRMGRSRQEKGENL